MSATPMLDFVVQALAPLSLDDLQQIDDDTGISKWTLQKIRLRQIDNPGVRSIEPLYQYLKLRAVRRRRVA
jgi:hypothetical protein